MAVHPSAHKRVRATVVAAARAGVERATGIEPAFSAWEADVLPLNYARVVSTLAKHR